MWPLLNPSQNLSIICSLIYHGKASNRYLNNKLKVGSREEGRKRECLTDNKQIFER